MAEKRFCEKCGTPSKAGAQYCCKCGHCLSRDDGNGGKGGQGKRGLFDSSRESMHARGYALAVILGVIIFVFCQQVVNNPMMTLVDNPSLESAREAINQAQIWSVFGVVIAVGGILGLIQYFNRSK